MTFFVLIFALIKKRERFMKSKVILIGIVLVSLLFSSCATIICGSTKQIPVTSSPDYATITIRNYYGAIEFTGVTPTVVTLKKGQAYQAEISLEGYETQIVPINTAFEPAFLGNIICGGVLGFIVDLATGAYLNLEPGNISVQLISNSELKTDNAPNADKYAVLRIVDLNGHKHKVIVPFVKA